MVQFSGSEATILYMFKLILLCGGLVTVFSAPLQAQNLPAKVAIIIDDIGYQKADPLLIRLPYPLTFAVMPYAPQTREMAELAARLNKEIMLHMPMEAVAQNHLLGKGALRQQMSKAQVHQALTQALAQVPQATGVNNHMGSLYTSLAPQMDWTMELMAARGLYFIDSKTTNRSAVLRASHRYQIKSRSRDIFLDNDKSTAALDKQFNQLIKLAKQQGSAVAIGHPYPETYRYLRHNLARLAAAGIELVPASQLLRLPATAMPAPPPVEVAATAQQPGHAVKRQVKLSPATTSSRAVTSDSESDVAATKGSVSLVYPAQQQVIAPATVTVPAEPMPWHPPYQPELPGFMLPGSTPLPPWQLWLAALSTTMSSTAAPQQGMQSTPIWLLR